MSLSLFIARRLYQGGQKERQVSRPAVLIAKAGIAIGLAVMIIAVCVIVGFKSEVRDKVVGFGGHIQINNLEQTQPYEPMPVGVEKSLMDTLQEFPQVEHIQRYAVKPGMLKTEDAFQGMVLKGVGQEYDYSFFRAHLLEGEFPTFTDSVSSNLVVISQTMADKLKLKVGDKLDAYFIEDEVRVRRPRVAGIYRTGFSEYDNLFIFTDLHTVNRLNGFQHDQAGGLEVRLTNYAALEDCTWELASYLAGRTDRYGAEYAVCNVEQLNLALFAWLGILDVNIWVILALMTGVAGFTMISGLLIIIIERTPMIGILKSLGAENALIRRVFLWLSVFLIGRGMLWGNAVGLGICLIQSLTGMFTLDSDTYYMDTVPIVFNVGYLVLLNLGTFGVSILMLVGPSCLIARIRPADSMRYE